MCSARPRSACPARRASGGFSLIEAIATTAFLSVVLLGLTSTSISLTRNEKTADSTGAAAALAQEKLEQLRSLPLGNAQTNTPGTVNDANNPLRADGTPGAGGRYNRSWTVSAANTPSNGVRTVSVNVAWNDAQPHTTRIAAYVRCANIPCVAP